MKKIIITLAVLAALTACSSSQEVKETPDTTVAVEEVAVVATPEAEEVVTEEVVTEEVVVADVAQTLYDKDGLVITSENNEITLVMPESVVFGFDKTDIKEEFKPALNLLADALKSNPEITANIAGYTDSTGNEEYNQKLSLVRAEKAKEYIVSEGVESERISTSGYGESDPVASNADTEGRSRNRRIEVTLTK